MNKSNKYGGNQFGFRKSISTIDGIIEIINSIIDRIENYEYVGSTLLDLTQAFVCVSHEILKEKLKFYNFEPVAILLICSFLSNRQVCCFMKIMFEECKVQR